MTVETLAVTISGETLVVQIGNVAASGGGSSGDVVGPASATDDRIAAFDGTTGKLIKQGTVTATAVASHLSSTSNPHSVTAAQVGADPAGTAAGMVGMHEVDTDPHGDRAFATSAVGTHNATTTGAHGMTAFGASLVDDVDASAARTTLGLGTAATAATGDFAAASHNHAASAITSGTIAHERGGLEADVSDYSGLVKITGGTTSAVTVTSAGEALLDDATAADQRTTLGLGTAATADTGDFAAASHTHAASDIASGTLDAARLPTPTTTELGGVKRNTGSAGQFVTGIDTDGSLLRDTPAGGASNTKWIGAGELIPRVTSGAGIDGEELATNDINLDYLAFDSATSEGAQVAFAWPSGFTTFTATFHWTAASGTGGVRWQASARCYADDDALDQAQGTSQAVSDTLLAANDAHKTAATSAVTPAGTVAAGNLCVVEITRAPSHGDDTIGVDARLIGVMLEFA